VSSWAEDREGEIVDQDSLAKAFPEFMRNSGIVVYMHNWGGGIGTVTDCAPAVPAAKDCSSCKSAVCKDPTHKTRIKCQYGEGYRIPAMFGEIAVDDIWKQIEQGIIRTHSFGFQAKRIEEPNKVPILDVTDVFEVSVVTVPANREAVFDVVKAMGDSMGQAMTFEDARKRAQEVMQRVEEEAGLEKMLREALVALELQKVLARFK
jgi:hypothetical protein